MLRRTGEDRPVCLCNEGYRGNGVQGCTRGDCISLRHDQVRQHYFSFSDKINVRIVLLVPGQPRLLRLHLCGPLRPDFLWGRTLLQVLYTTLPDPDCISGGVCSPTANCRGVQHKAECSCPPGTAGEPRTGGVCSHAPGGGALAGGVVR